MLNVMKRSIKNSLKRLRLHYVAPEKTDVLYASFSKEAIVNKKFVNICAGNFNHPYWINLDFETEQYKSIQKNRFTSVDVQNLETLPFDTDSVELVYCSHAIEHFKEERVQHLLSEIRRVLVSEGIVRIVVPDASYIYRLLRFNRIHELDILFKDKLSRVSGADPNTIQVQDLFLSQIATALTSVLAPTNSGLNSEKFYSLMETKTEDEFLDQITALVDYNYEHPDYHVSWWSQTKLDCFLKQAGFSATAVVSYNKTLAAPFMSLGHFDKTTPYLSSYVEALK